MVLSRLPLHSRKTPAAKQAVTKLHQVVSGIKKSSPAAAVILLGDLNQLKFSRKDYRQYKSVAKPEVTKHWITPFVISQMQPDLGNFDHNVIQLLPTCPAIDPNHTQGMREKGVVFWVVLKARACLSLIRRYWLIKITILLMSRSQ